MMPRAGILGVLLVTAGAALAVWDLEAIESKSIVVYTTPALRDVLEKGIVPAFENATGYDVALVYIPAGQQYNRLRMSPGHAEADLFLHASPLFIEKGADEGAFFAPYTIAQDAQVPASLKAAADADGKRLWYAWAWSPLVEVYAPRFAAPPDLATLDTSFGFPHPQLANNGVYAVLLYEAVSPKAGQLALQQTRVQPANARANIGGVADGSFDVTLGYEAVVRTFLAQGARVEHDLPVLGGEEVTTRVLVCAGVVKPASPTAEALLRFLFEPATQETLGAYHFRSAFGNTTAGILDPGSDDSTGLDVSGARITEYDWSQWAALDAKLKEYVVQ